MKIYTHIERIKRLNALIQREATGTPLQLAEKLNVSKSTANRLIAELKDRGAPILYCKHSQSYKYTEAGYNFEI
ncbi:MarR family transcriptional regulator [Flavobacteriaceae bacterium]|nr:MarR family transcriptional regulator [Flavobacteriaceae bacterium]